MVHNFLGNPHKTEYDDIDEDFNILAEEFVDDDQDSSDYEDEDDDYEEEEDEIEEDDDDDDDAEDYWDLGFLSDSDIDTDAPGPPDGGFQPAEDAEDMQKEEPTISTDKESIESKSAEDKSTVHRNIENNSET